VSLSNVLIIKVHIVPIINLFCYFATAVTFVVYCLFIIFFLSGFYFFFCLFFCGGSIKGACAVKHALKEKPNEFIFKKNNSNNHHLTVLYMKQ